MADGNLEHEQPRKHPVMAAIVAASLAVGMFVVLPLAVMYEAFATFLAVVFFVGCVCGLTVLLYFGVRDWEESGD